MSEVPHRDPLAPGLTLKSALESSKQAVSRRRFIRTAAIAGATAALAPASALAALSAPRTPRRLRLFNLHTGERLDAVYYESGRYVGQALDAINYILRDFRQNAIKPIHPGLLDLVVAIRRRLGTEGEIAVISGYRTPQTNAMLAAHSRGVARHSLHVDAMALDFRVPERTLEEVHRAAVAMRGGGVGYYPRSDFVHVDVGRVRYW
ncbi:MAG TPA: DUF882 domain-containing protein [Candidatus Binataceae bacterium]|jgi:uncharacterized protein YcbK (DUF882 family)|nr:DUF882 domain-containing protein [Candidatus Binataceae bacterium]